MSQLLPVRNVFAKRSFDQRRGGRKHIFVVRVSGSGPRLRCFVIGSPRDPSDAFMKYVYPSVSSCLTVD
jgi:hypothetical protein